MGIVWFSGGETGDLSETGGSSAGTFSVQSTTVRSGAYSYKFSAVSSALESKTGWNLTSANFRFAFQFSETDPGDLFIAGLLHSGDNFLCDIWLDSTRKIALYDETSGTQIQIAVSTTAFAPDVWHIIEIQMVVSNTVGGYAMRVNGNEEFSVFGFDTLGAGGNIDRALFGPSAAFGNIGAGSYYDDLAVSDSGWLGDGHIIARQFKSGTPTYDSWSKTSGTIDNVWNATPFSATNAASSSTANSAQTGLIASLSSTQSGHGSQVIASSDIINAAKAAFVAKTASTAAAGLSVIGTPQFGSSTAGGNVTLTFDVAPIAGDVVFVSGGHRGTSSNQGPSTAGYTQVAALHDGGGSTGHGFGVWYKVQGSTPDTNVVCLGGGTAGDGVVYNSIVLRGVAGTVLDVAATTAGPTASTNPNAPSITPANASAVIAFAGSTASDAAPGTVTNYTVAAIGRANATRPNSIALAYRLGRPAGTPEDPAAFNAWTTGTWYAVTVAVREAGGEAGSAAKIRRRIGGADTDTTITLTTSDAYYETAAFTATLANLNAGEIGVVHGNNAASQTVEDAWLLVDYAEGTGVTEETIGTAAGLGAASATGNIVLGATGTAAGLGTASATGLKTAVTTATAAGLGAASATGQKTATTTATAAGLGAASATSLATATTTATAAGLGTASATGRAIVPVTGTAAGLGSAAATGQKTATTTATAAGLGAASATSLATALSTGSAAGLGTATGVSDTGGAIASATGTAAGLGTASATGRTIVPATGTAAGLGAASATSLATAVTIGTAAGLGSAAATGRATATTTATAAGLGTASATGQKTAVSTGAAAGLGAATATATAIRQTIGTAAGLGSAAGTTLSTASATGAAAGLGTAAATSRAIIAATGTAAGLGTATGVSQAGISTGTAAGLGTASATGRATHAVAGTAAGLGSASAIGTAVTPAIGAASGTGAASAIGTKVATSTATAAGLGTASSSGAAMRFVLGTGTAAGTGAASASSQAGAATIGTAAGTGTASAAAVAIFEGAIILDPDNTASSCDAGGRRRVMSNAGRTRSTGGTNRLRKVG